MSETEKTELEQEDMGKTYEREDSETGYATKMSETALLKASRKYDVIANALLGNYDDDGHYTIAPEILKELAGLRKLVGTTNEFGTELKAPYKNGVSFNFLLKLGKENPETHTAESTLYLMEIINKVNGYIQNILTTPVATYTYKFDEHYKDYCYRAFNVVSNIDDKDEGALNGDNINIDKRLEYLEAVKTVSKDKYLVLEESFFNSRLQILNELPQGALVLSEFNKKRAALEKYFMNNPKNKYRALNELLTSIIEAYFDDLENTPAYKIAIQILILKYLNQVMEISGQIKASEEYKKAIELPAKTMAPAAPAPAPTQTKKAVKGNVKIASAPKKSSGPKAEKWKPAKYTKMKDDKLTAKLKAGGGGGVKKTTAKTKTSVTEEKVREQLKTTEEKPNTKGKEENKEGASSDNVLNII